MGFLGNLLGKSSSNINYDKAFAATPAQVFEGDPNGTPAAPPSYALREIQEIAKRSHLNPLFYQRCGILQNYDIVLLLDDSGSMNLATDTKDSFGNRNTRWTELQEVVKMVIEIGASLDSDGLDVHFLNRPSVLNVTSPKALDATFSQAPKGMTPLPQRTQDILTSHRAKGQRKNLLLLLATDGEPSGHGAKQAFRSVLEARDFEREKIGILACSDDDTEVGYLNEYDNQIPALDVIDDYRSEKKQVRGVQGMFFPFSRGDYTMKALLGPIDKWTDQLDEKKLTAKQQKYAQYGDV